MDLSSGNTKIICPNCGKEIDEITDHFHGCDTYKFENGIFVQIPKNTIENYRIVHKECGKELPVDMVIKITALMNGA